jgi:preprotein translocase subunit YajC
VYFSALLLQPVGPKATPGITVDSTQPSPSGGQQSYQSQQQGGGSMWVMMAPILVVMVVMLFMNRTQRKKDAETRAKLKKGDRVVSQSGIIGELVDMDDRVAKVKIAPGTNVSMLVSTISPFEAVAAKADDKQLKDLKEAKATAGSAGDKK